MGRGYLLGTTDVVKFYFVFIFKNILEAKNTCKGHPLSWSEAQTTGMFIAFFLLKRHQDLNSCS